MAGAGDAAYLTWEWYAAASSSWCDVGYFSCSTVRNSAWAHVGPVPTAVVGVVGFLVLLGLAGMALRGRERLGPWTTDQWLLAFAAVGALIGVGLTIIEVFAIHAICLLCAFGFALDLGILGLAVMLQRGS